MVWTQAGRYIAPSLFSTFGSVRFPSLMPTWGMPDPTGTLYPNAAGGLRAVQAPERYCPV